MSNRIVTRCASLLLAAFVVAGCSDDEPTGIDVLPFDISPIAFTLDQGGTKTVKLTGIAVSDVTFETTDPAIATVSATGVVTGVAPGTVAITAVSKANTADKASATFAVVAVQGTLVTPGTPITGISGAVNTQAIYRVFVPEGTTSLTIATSGGTGDLDLYVRYAALPVITSAGVAGTFNCRPYLAGNNETCTFTNPNEGSWYIRLHAYEAFSGVTLTATRVP